MMYLRSLLFLTVFVSLGASQKDLGYESLFTTSDTEIHECQPLKSRLPFQQGTWLIPSVAKFEMGGNNFTSVLDGFGKFNKFSFSEKDGVSSVCFTSKMIGSGFYNTSVDKGKIAPSILFMDTAPPLNYRPMELLNGPNDNVYVNTANVGVKMISLTDSQYMLQFSMDDLSVENLIQFVDTIDTGKMTTGSAHVQKRGDCLVGIDPQCKMDGSQSQVLVYEMCPDGKHFHRKLLNSYETDYLPYFHSFGLTANYAVLPHQSFYFNYGDVLKEGQPLVDAIVNITDNSPLVVKLLPLNGGDPITMEIDNGGPFYYFHFINSFETTAEDGSYAVVMDLSVLSFNMLPYFTLEMERTKAIRDASLFGNVVVKRYTMFVSGPRAGKWEVGVLSNPKRSTDFPSFNKNYQSKESCIFYALEWFHDELTYADMAVQKVNACSGEPITYWYKDNYFPSEATFVPNRFSNVEDDGVLLFTAVHGATQQSYLMIVDAKSMETLEEIAVPGIITFTTHGQFYSSLLN